MKQNETTSSATQGVSVEQKRTAAKKQLRDDFCKRIEQLMNDTDDLCKRIYELSENIEDYIINIEENVHEELDEEDENLQQALRHIKKAFDKIGEDSRYVDWAYEATSVEQDID